MAEIFNFPARMGLNAESLQDVLAEFRHQRSIKLFAEIDAHLGPDSAPALCADAILKAMVTGMLQRPAEPDDPTDPEALIEVELKAAMQSGVVAIMEQALALGRDRNTAIYDSHQEELAVVFSWLVLILTQAPAADGRPAA